METKMTATFLKTMIFAGVASAAIAVSSAGAQDGVEVGKLTCGVKGGVSFVIGSTKQLRCLFQVNPDDPGERYEGSIAKVGLDIGVTRNALLIWTVLARTTRVESGALAGKYVGVAADASV